MRVTALEPPRPASDSKNSLEVAEPGSIDTTEREREYTTSINELRHNLYQEPGPATRV